MLLSIMTYRQADAVVFDLSGRLCFLEYELRDRINALLDQGLRKFILDMEDVSHIDSFGLGQLVAAWTTITGKGGEMTLVRPNAHVLKLLEITKLNTVFPISEMDLVGHSV